MLVLFVVFCLFVVVGAVVGYCAGLRSVVVGWWLLVCGVLFGVVVFCFVIWLLLGVRCVVCVGGALCVVCCLLFVVCGLLLVC